MSIQIGGPGAIGTSVPTVTAQTRGEPPPQAAAAGDDDAVKVDTFVTPLSSDVDGAIDAAANAYDRLAAGGHQVHFSNDPATGAFRVELQDLDGNTVSPLSASDVLRIAGGDEV